MRFFTSAEMQSVYPTTPDDGAWHSWWGVLPLCRDAVGVFYSPSQRDLTLVARALSLCRHAVGVFYSPRRRGMTLVVGVLSLCRDAVGVFYSPRRRGLTLVVGGLASLQRYSRCILQSQPTRPDTCGGGGSCLSAEIQSVYSTAPDDGAWHSWWGVLPLCRDTVGDFYSPSQRDLTHAARVLSLCRHAVGVFYSHRRRCLTVVVGVLVPLQRCSRCILQPQTTGLTLVGGGSCLSAEIQSVYSTVPANKTWHLWWWWGVLALCRDTVGVFYSPSRRGLTLVVGGLASLQRYSRCILQSKPTRPDTCGGRGVLPLCRGTVSVFYSPRRRGLTRVVGGLASLQRCSRCILQPQPTGPHTRGDGFVPLQRYSRCILQPQTTGPDRRDGGLVPLQRCSRCILQPQTTGPDTLGGGSCLSAEIQSVYSTAPDDYISTYRYNHGFGIK